jgi:hypothetical protein
MEPVLIGLLLAGGVGALGVGLARRLFRREWTGEWRGQTVRLVVSRNRKELYVGGRRVAEKTTLSGNGCTLSATMREETPATLAAVVAYPPGSAGPVGRIYANGQWIGGEPRESHDRATTSPSATPEPVDARWPAARQLLGDLRAAGDPRATEAAERIEDGLRHVLGRLDRLVAAREAHLALGGDDQRLDAARAALDGRVQEVVEAPAA